MHAFDVLGDPVRRRILELLAAGELTSGDLTAAVRAEFGISQPAVSRGELACGEQLQDPPTYGIAQDVERVHQANIS